MSATATKSKKKRSKLETITKQQANEMGAGQRLEELSTTSGAGHAKKAHAAAVKAGKNVLPIVLDDDTYTVLEVLPPLTIADAPPAEPKPVKKPSKPHYSCGKKHGIDAAKARAIKDRLADGAKRKDLAAEFGTVYNVISNIHNGHVWKDA
jgi:hypothetical protein